MSNLQLNQRPHLMEPEPQFRISMRMVLGFVFSVLFGSFVLYHDHQVAIDLDIRKREVESIIDEKARVANHFIDRIPRCFVGVSLAFTFIMCCTVLNSHYRQIVSSLER
ncbi:hypothetical protein BJ875DRAFT_21758 [Amylocarpus encephaloides]|uniref:Uncharacterized protein n=1 Tax=Amylocarpus encephaloides TaxID=45428 RepID=A0A9P7YJJ6_9HELO|nr:hypothetical protein BJ875DRAFT_21758 [Amylocarpus encephaloides]